MDVGRVVSMATKGQHQGLLWWLYQRQYPGCDIVSWFCKMLPFDYLCCTTGYKVHGVSPLFLKMPMKSILIFKWNVWLKQETMMISQYLQITRNFSKLYTRTVITCSSDIYYFHHFLLVLLSILISIL